MGWRFRKRIKILPGVHINISKSGISTNVGVKGASVTFSPKGTYVNTGIPGSGFYRRDKVSGVNEYNRSIEGQQRERISQEANLFDNNDYDEKSSLLVYNPVHYIFYIWSLLFPIVAFAWYLNGLDMLYSSLINAGFQFVLCFAIIANMSIKSENSAYRIKSIDDTPQNKIKLEMAGHMVRCFLYVMIIILNLFPIFSMNGSFVRMICGYELTWGGGIFVFLITLLIVVCWITAFIKEKRFLILLNNAILLKQGINENKRNNFDKSENGSDEQIAKAKLETLEENLKEPSSDADGSLPQDLKGSGSLCDEEILKSHDSEKVLKLENYHYPTTDLLNRSDYDRTPDVDMGEQQSNKDRIVDTLRNFDILISSIKATVGPRVTLYEITLAPGVNASELRGLEDDLALALCSHDVHFLIPIPGKGTIGIEVPNIRPSIVSMESVLNTKKFQDSTMELPCAIGKTITNEVFMFDITQAPHILIAGSTGQGKSVALNAMIMSLLFKKHPAELKLVLMDPYGVEFGVYTQIAKQFLASLPNEPAVVSNSRQAISTLNGLCREMSSRYDLLKIACVKNVQEYNDKFINHQLNPAVGHKFMSYIVVVIDEYGDFIEEKGQDFEAPIVQLAQNARAVGIHMIISTKRPTNDIITGAIKANFPTRIAFRLPERIDSQVILDCDGAEELSGNGDMLFRSGKSPDCIRVQCAFVDTQEIERINEFISSQQGYTSSYKLSNSHYDGECGVNGVDLARLDPLFEDAARLIVMNQDGSASLIQRHLAIGYNRAGRIMNQLEKAGIVGAAHGSGSREVLIKDEMGLESLLSQWRD